MEYAVTLEVTNKEEGPTRGSVRYPLQLPVTLMADGEQSKAVTVDISASGVRFRLGKPLRVGQKVEFLVEIPAGTLDFTHTAALHGCGRVVREYRKEGRPFAAAVIDEYRFQ